ncbi:unnamed protein product [Sphagnum balticum]
MKQADAGDVFQLDEFAIDYKNYDWIRSGQTPLLIYPMPVKEALNLDFNINVFQYGYLDGIVESLTDQTQFAAVGLQLSLGVRLTDWLQVGYYHHSQHILDGTIVNNGGAYPEEDAVELKLTIYHARAGREALF